MTVSPSRTHSLFEMLFWRIIPACSYTPLNSRWWILMRKSGVKLKVLSERTFWQKVMKEVLKDLRLEFRGCCHDKEVFEHTKVPLLRPNYKYLSTDVWHWAYNLLNLASEVIGHDPKESADSATASASDGTAAANGTSYGVLLSETVYYADGTVDLLNNEMGYWKTETIWWKIWRI